MNSYIKDLKIENIMNLLRKNIRRVDKHLIYYANLFSKDMHVLSKDSSKYL